MSEFSKTQVLVTGGNGAVGCNLVKKLLDYDAKVTVLDDFSQSKRGNLCSSKNLQIIKGDIINSKVLKKTFSHNYQFVFHLAARFANEMSVKDPYEDLRVNIEGTLKLLMESAKHHVNRFIYASSSSLYGQSNSITKKENSMPKPSTPYAASKLSGEFYCNAVSELYSLDYAIVRLSNCYGPYDPPGKFRNVIPNFIKASLANRNLIITGNGNETRDFTFVDDIVDGIILAATKQKVRNEIFNLGTGKETKISIIAKQIIKNTNSKSKIVFRSRRSFDHITRRRMDISKAKKLLGYSPKINVFDGIKKTCVWAQQNW
jgi:nucleoside-diphosphate-sugar epimerase